MKNILFTALFFPFVIAAQVNMNGTGSYSENFDGLLDLGTNNQWVENGTIPNWYSQRTVASTSYAASTGSSSTGGLYSFGSSGSSERALGSIGSTNGGSFAHGVLLENIGTDVINNISLTYTLEEWRNGGSNSPQTITVWYKVSATRDTLLNPDDNTGWTEITALAGSSPLSSATSSALDGNIAANRVTLNGVLPITLSAGSYLMIRWSDINHPGNDDGLAIDDVSLSWGTCAPTIGTDIQTACDSYTWPVDGNTYTVSNNTATYTLLNAAGCDSIVSLDLTLNQSSWSYMLEQSCVFPFTASSGVTYYTAGIYVTTTTNSNGCPQIDSVDVQVDPNLWLTQINSDPNLPILFTDPFLIEGFQWYDCSSDQILPGETNDTLMIPGNGSFALIANWPHGCVDTSTCINVFWMGLDELSTSIIDVQPNPSNGNFDLIFNQPSSPVKVEITGLNGQIVFEKVIDGATYTVSLSHLSKGTYIVKATTSDAILKRRIVIE